MSMMSVIGIIYLLPAQYVNWRGSINGSVSVMLCFFLTLCIAFITRDVSPEVVHSFDQLFLGMGTTMECFHIRIRIRIPLLSCKWGNFFATAAKYLPSAISHIWGTVLPSMDCWNRSWNTPPSCSAQHRQTRPPMLAGPLAVFSLVLLTALTTSSVLFSCYRLEGGNDCFLPGGVVHRKSWKDELRSLEKNAWLLPGTWVGGGSSGSSSVHNGHVPNHLPS